ncbi:MAG TPA: CCA tRNA nucleotidyltransferase [Candidatus Fraserbacteria bacterium]|nr:CCA tRNA nucleotidyltransferase [Candidatus Fraserbacteria bacterium]
MSRLRIDVEAIFASHPFARTILSRLEAAGHEAVLIGGIVRDALRAQFDADYEFEPLEVDIATSASPQEVRALSGDSLIIEVGAAFGVLVLVGPEGHAYEVATFRTEGEYDGRRPGAVKLVRSLADDVHRRDLTINGLAARSDGWVIDLVGGVSDLKRKLIRAIGDPAERFGEDYLRILRAIRCACLIDGEIVPEVAQAIRRHRTGLTLISAERVAGELLRLLGTNQAARGVRLLDEYGILPLILPELVACQGVEQPGKYHPEGDVYQHTLLALEIADGYLADPLVKLALLLHDLGKPEALERNRGVNMAGHDQIGAELAGQICRRLHLSKEASAQVVYLVREHQRIGHFPQMSRSKQVRLLRSGEERARPLGDFTARFPRFARLVQLMIADCQASAMKSSGWLPVLAHTARLLPHLQALEQLEGARRLIDGHDFLKLGVPPGPELGRMLEQVREAILAGRIVSRRGALAAARRLAGQR